MKSNIGVRMMSMMVLLSLAITHFTGQMNLLSPTWLWLAAFAGLMGFQASFTGFCPSTRMFGGKKSGTCCGG